MATLRSLGCDKALGLAFPSSETNVAEELVSWLTEEFVSNTGSVHHECPGTVKRPWLPVSALPLDLPSTHASKVLVLPGGGRHFTPSTWEAKAGGFLNLRPAWST